jgi:large subunit ribosomal protein L14
MVFQDTILFLADNSGPKKVKCLNIKKKKIGYLADILVVVVKKRFLRRKKIKKNILCSILINSKFKFKRRNGFCISFGKNKGLLLNHNLVFLGSNVKAVVCKEIKKYKKKFKKIISYSGGNV